MSKEIEIKFCINPETPFDISVISPSLTIIEQSCCELGNTYFDTPTLSLRQLDMGLRIRRWDAQAEQTIKCRGQVVGGLHARPEYNAPVTGGMPQLSAFPEEIWPAGSDVVALQQALIPLFRTDFKRTTWLVEFAGTRIELARDEGEIEGAQGREPILELELELKDGPVDGLFQLALALVQSGKLRPGHQSKAQRGYRLAGQAKPWALRQPLAVDGPLNAQIAALADDLQFHEGAWLAGVAGSAERMAQSGAALLALSQGLPWQPELSQWLARWQSGAAQEALYMPAYGAFLLTLSAWLQTH